MRRDETTIGESERWLSVIAGGMLTLSSLRRRDLGAGALFALTGAALIFRGIVGNDRLLGTLRGAAQRQPARPSGAATAARDEVEEASMESFPASDPPSWTPTAGSEASGADDAGSDDENEA